jgi:peptidylprolyl isomerase
MNPQVGDTLALATTDGRQVPAQLVEIDDEKLTFDLNHPLAGKTLTFAIEVVDISDSPSQNAMGCGSGSGCDCSSGCSC